MVFVPSLACTILCVMLDTQTIPFAQFCESTQTPQSTHTQIQRILLQDPVLASTINRAVNWRLVDPAQPHHCHIERIQTPPFLSLAADLVKQVCACHPLRYSSDIFYWWYCFQVSFQERHWHRLASEFDSCQHQWWQRPTC